MTAEAAGLYLDYSKNRITDETSSCCSTGGGVAACASASTRCSAATRSTSRRTAPSCTWRCARRAAHRSSWTARTSCPRSTRCSTGWPTSAEPRAERRVEGPHRQAHPQRRQHRHRRLRPRPGDGLRGAQALQRARHDVPLRVQRRRHRLRRGDARSRSRGNAVHRLVEDLHDARDDDQRADSARLVAAGPRRRREVGRQALRRRLDERGRRWRSSASTPPTCSGSGTGSAGAIPWTRRSASRRCSPSARRTSARMLDGFHQMDEHFRTAPFERNLPVLMGLLAVWYTDFFGAADRRGPALRAVPEAIPGLSAAADDGEQRQARHARRDRRSTTRPARSTGASREPTASIRSTS